MKEWIGAFLPVIVLLLLIILVLGLITYFTQNFEGVASIGLLVVATVILIWFGREVIENKVNTIIVLVIFTFLGLVFDGAGNFIYNKPIQMLCPAETYLNREVIISEDYEGNTTHNHVFSCFAENQEKAIKHFPLYQTGGIRFFEYIFLGTILLGFYWIINRFVLSKK